MSKKTVDMADAAPGSSSPGGSNGNEGDNKILAEAGRNTPNSTVTANMNTDTPIVPGNFHEFAGSQSKQYVTYAERQETIAKALGTKAPLVS